MIAGAVAEGIGLQVREAAEDRDLVAQVRERRSVGVSSNPAPVVAGVHWFWMTPLAM